MQTTGMILVFAVFFIIGYDIFAIFMFGVQGTISRVILTSAHGSPIIAFAAGVLCGHLFWPQPTED